MHRHKPADPGLKTPRVNEVRLGLRMDIEMGTTHRNTSAVTEPTDVDMERRAFLRKSRYLAYTTPAIMSLVVEKAGATGSYGAYCESVCTNENCEPLNPRPCQWERWTQKCSENPELRMCQPRSQ